MFIKRILVSIAFFSLSFTANLHSIEIDEATVIMKNLENCMTCLEDISKSLNPLFFNALTAQEERALLKSAWHTFCQYLEKDENTYLLVQPTLKNFIEEYADYEETNPEKKELSDRIISLEDRYDAVSGDLTIKFMLKETSIRESNLTDENVEQLKVFLKQFKQFALFILPYAKKLETDPMSLSNKECGNLVKVEIDILLDVFPGFSPLYCLRSKIQNEDSENDEQCKELIPLINEIGDAIEKETKALRDTV